MPDPTPPLTCAHCTRYLDNGYFTVTRVPRPGIAPVGTEGRPVGTAVVNVCSLLCLIQWAYKSGVRGTAVMAARARGFFDEIAAALRGGPRIR